MYICKEFHKIFMLKKFSISILLIFTIHNCWSQQLAAVEEGVLYRKEASFGITLHSQGFGIAYRNNKHLTGKSKRILEFDLLSMKHPKEIKSVNKYYEKPRGFVYGKLNSLAIFRGGLGLQKVVYQKDEAGNIEVRYNFCGGASLGFAKPVYLYILEESSDPYTPDKILVKYKPEEHPLDVIYGKAPFGYAVERTRIHPGLYAKGGVSFDWADEDDKVRSLEIGLVADYYFSSIQLMAYSKATPIFTTIYATIAFGNKKN